MHILDMFSNKQVSIFPPIFIVLLYGIALLQHWFVALYNKMGDKTFFEVITSTLITYITEYAWFLNRPEAFSGYAATLPPLIERAANTTGFSLLVFLSVIGCLFWLSKKYRDWLYIFNDIMYHTTSDYYFRVPALWHPEYNTKPVVCLCLLLFKYYGCICTFNHIFEDV